MANTPTTDLTSLYTDGTTNWTELTNYGAGSAEALEEEAFLQGSNCVSQQIATNKTGAASGLDYSATDPGGFVDGTDVFFFWWLFLFPSALNDYNETVGQTAPSQNSPGTASGFFIGIGSSATNHDWYAVGGADYGRYPYGGWQNVAIDPGQSASWTDGPPATSTYTNFGFLPNVISAPSRGQSLVVDAIRWGRGLIQYTGGSPAGTFDDIADTNDTVTNRWGIFQRGAGSFLFKGKLELGTTASSLLFDASNRNINIDDTRQVYTGFNVIEINNASSDITWTNISITKLKYLDALAFDNSKGNIVVNNGATFDVVDCTFTDMNTFDFGSSSTTVSGTIFRRCALVTTNGAVLTSCDFIQTTAASAVTVSSFSEIITSTFQSDGSSHAIELTGTVPSTYTWNHVTSGYATGSTGTITPTSTGNETLYINPAVADSTNITITVPSGITLPSIRVGANYTGTVVVQIQQKTIDVNVKDESGSPISGAFVWINDGTTTIFNGTTDVNGDIPQQTYGGSNNSTLRVRKYGFEPFETTLGTATGSVSQLVTALTDDQQQDTPPTPASTWTINTTASTITMTSGITLPHTSYATMDTALDLYQYTLNIFAATNFMQFSVPFESVTANQFNFINGWTFGAKDNDYKFLYDGSFFDAANVIQWSNVRTIGTQETGTGIYIVQGVEASDAALTSWWPDGNLNVLVKTRDTTWIQSTDDTATNIDGGVWLFAREYGDLYDHFFIDLSVQGQNVVALSTSDDLNNTTAEGTVSGYTDITVTIGSTSQDIGDGDGNQPYNALIDCNGRPLSEVYEYLKYITRTGADSTALLGTTDNGYEYRNADEANFSNVDNKQAPFGTFAGGRFFGAYGVFITNMASSDNTNYQLTDSNGVIRSPPQTVSFELTGLKDGTEVRIFEDTLPTVTEVAGVETVSGGSGSGINNGSGTVSITGSTDNNVFTYSYTYSTDIDIFVRIVNVNNFQIQSLEGLTLTNQNQTIPVSQIEDRNFDDPV